LDTRCTEAPRSRGAYILVIRASRPVEARVRGGVRSLCPGVYLYVGSAGGPGGLRARLTRHVHGPRRRHWHIDWLTGSDACSVVAAVYTTRCWGVKAEACLAGCLEAEGLTPIPGFGATDDPRSETHLYLAATTSDALAAAMKCIERCCGGGSLCSG